MKFAFDTPLTDFADQVIKDETGQPILLGTLVCQALSMPGKKDATGVEKNMRCWVGIKVHRGEDLNVTEAALIKEAVGDVLTPIPVGRIWELLEHPLASEYTHVRHPNH